MRMKKQKPISQPTRRPPVQARSEASRAKILAAARKAFAENGYDGTNVRDIAADIGMTHTLIRYHFGSKELLWKDVVRDMYARLDAALSPDVIGAMDVSTRDGLRKFLRHYIRYCAEHPEQARIMIAESQSGSERLEWMVEYIRKSHRALAPIFRGMMEDGLLPEVWLVSFFYIISTVCQMPFVLSNTIETLYGVDMQSDAAIEAHTEAVLALLLREPAGQPSAWPSLPDWVGKR